MKIRNHRKREWWFYPHEKSNIEKKSAHIFKKKSSLMKFLNKHGQESLNGQVRIEEKSFGHSGCVRMYSVWYNEYENQHKNIKPRIVLKQMDFRGRKFIQKLSKIDKHSKKYFAFSDKIINLMCHIENEDTGVILEKDAVRLIKLFKKRGFEDFEPTEDEWIYINGHISDGICFFHWSDRCNWLRVKTIIEYFKREGLVNNI